MPRIKLGTMNIEEHDFFEVAQRRINQKKRLFRHFVLLLIAVIVFVIAKLLGYMLEQWYIFVLLAWGGLFLYHLISVFVFYPFIGQEWERKERERLINIQRQKSQKIQEEVEKLYSQNTQNTI